MIIDIPADVRDNSEAVTDYAFMRDRVRYSWAWAYHTVDERHREIKRVTQFPELGLTHYQWHDTSPNGQRCRFDMIVNADGVVVNLFHTEYFTRVPCITHDAHYARAYASITDYDGVTTIASPYCDECLRSLRRSAKDAEMTFNESEPLHIGQH